MSEGSARSATWASAARLLPPGLTLSSVMRSRLKNREVSTRKQVGDAESVINRTENHYEESL